MYSPTPLYMFMYSLFVYVCVCMGDTTSVQTKTSVCVCVCVCACVRVFYCVSEVNVDRPVCLPSGLFLHPPLQRACISPPQLYCFFLSSLSLLPSHLCDTLCAFVLPVLLVQFILLPSGTFFFFFPLFSPSLNLTPSHALSISCGLSGLQSCVMGDRRGRLRSITLICRG